MIEPAVIQSALPPVFLPDSQLLFGVFGGVLLTAATYLFFIWLAIRDRSQIFLILMLLAMLGNLGFAYAHGLNTASLSADFAAEVSSLFWQNTMLLSFYAAACYFTLYYLELDYHYKKLALLVRLMALGMGAAFLLLAFNTLFISTRLPFIGMGVCGLLLLAGLMRVGGRGAGAMIHALAFALLLAGTLASHFKITVSDSAFGNALFYSFTAAAALVFAIGIARQFSARQEEKEKQLTISNERFALAALGSNEGLFDWNVEEKDVFFSDRMKKIVGRDLAQSEDGLEQWWSAIDPAQQDRIRDSIKNFMQGEAITISFEYRIRRPEGKVRWLYTTGVALRDLHGKLRRLVGSTGDITERKQAEVGLRDSEARFRGIIEAHPVPVVIISIESQEFLYASPSVVSIIGVPPQEVHNQPALQFFTNITAAHELLAEVVQHGLVEARELTMRRLDGTTVPVAISARLIDFQHKMAVVMGIADLTERAAATQQIEEQRIALEQSEKLAALGSLLAGVAHELNNPLSVVVGQSTLLLEGSSDPKIATRADKIKKAAERCTKIVKNFLALARRKDPERKPVQLNNVIHSAFELLMPQLKNDNVDGVLLLADDLPLVMADADQLTQIITNLVLNAKQAVVERAAPRVVKIITQHNAADGKIQLRVADNGSGVPPEIQRRIFEPFFTTKKEGRGTGIGLSLSLGLAEAHGGSIHYEDTPGGGATFVLSLPIGAIAEVTAPDDFVAQSDHEAKKILLVDDEPDVMQILAELLKADGHTTVEAEHGQAALDHLRAQQFDLIISDLRMPVMDGPTLYRTILAELPAYKNRIFFVTGDTLSPHVRTFLEEYPVLVIDKPYMRDDVRQALARQLKIAEKTAANNPTQFT